MSIRRILDFRILAVVALTLSFATSSAAAPTVGAPTGYTRFSLGGAEFEFADVVASPTGWILVGTSMEQDVIAPQVTSIDLDGKTLWQKRLASGNALATAVTPTGSIWIATIDRSLPTSEPTPIPTSSPTSTPTSTESSSIPNVLDPDGVGAVDALPEGRFTTDVVLQLLDPSGQELASVVAPLTDGWVGQPTALIPWKDGVLVVGTAVHRERGVRTGYVQPVVAGSASLPLYLGSTTTTFTAAVQSGNVVLVAGSSSETLLGKASIGAQDAIVATYNGSRFTRVIRSSGGQRMWSSIATSGTSGYTTAGWSVAAGKSEAVVSSYTATGAVRWTKRYPGSIPAQEQRLIRIASSLRLALAASSANAILYPGWAPKGSADLLLLSLDESKGTTIKVTTVASTGREELVDAVGSPLGGLLLLRSDGSLPGGSGSVIAARLSPR